MNDETRVNGATGSRRRRGLSFRRIVRSRATAGSVLVENVSADFLSAPLGLAGRPARSTASCKERDALRMLTVRRAPEIQALHGRVSRHEAAAHTGGGFMMTPINVNSRHTAPIDFKAVFGMRCMEHFAYDSALGGEIVRHNKILYLPRRQRRQIVVVGARHAWVWSNPRDGNGGEALVGEARSSA